MQCSICLGEIEVGSGGWSEGHNAAPVNDGRCCGDCNRMIVIPARFAAICDINPYAEAKKEVRND
jgi:hypothetical protein